MPVTARINSPRDAAVPLSKAREQAAATQQYLTKETPGARANELEH